MVSRDNSRYRDAMEPAALHAVTTTGPASLDESLRDEIGRLYPRWHVWISRDGTWHARRRGAFLEDENHAAMYHLAFSGPGLLALALTDQDQLPLGGGQGT